MKFKRFFARLTMLTMLLGSVTFSSAAETVSKGSGTGLEGNGTAEAPWLISEAADFVAMAANIDADANYADDCYLMTADIDFTGVAMTSIGKTNHFRGVFDGGFHVVRNLTLTDTTMYTGLFSYVTGGTVKNLGMKDCNITGGKRVGAMIGGTMNALVVNCYSEGTVTANSSDAGGLIGMFNSSDLYNCYTSGTVTSLGSTAGGITGSINSSLDLTHLATVDNLYSTATVRGTKLVGAISGWEEGYSAGTPVNATNVYYINTLPYSGKYDREGTVKLTEKQITDGTLMDALNGNLAKGYATWRADESGKPIFPHLSLNGAGTVDSPYLIATAEDLVTVSTLVETSAGYASAHYKMTASIDLDGTYFGGIGRFAPFTGSFDGAGHVVKNIAINNKSGTAGFFGFLKDATVKNLGIQSGTVQGGVCVGGICGRTDNAVLLNCFNGATVIGYTEVGGLVGMLNNSDLYNSYNTGLIRGTKSVGGLCGAACTSLDPSDPSGIGNCYNIGHVNFAKFSGNLFGYSDTTVFAANLYYNCEQLPDVPIGNEKPLPEVNGKTEAELKSETLADALNANVEEGWMEWALAEDGRVRLAQYAEVAAIDLFTADIEGVTVADGKVQPILSADGKFMAVVYGSDHKSVIDLAGNVYQPLTDTTVVLMLKIQDAETSEELALLDRNITVEIEGLYENSGVNAMPNVVPGLREWYGLSGEFVLSESAKLVYTDPSMDALAARLQQYFEETVGFAPGLSAEGGEGDIFLQYNTDRAAELQEEGYAVAITDRVTIEAATETAMLYGGITLLQILDQSDACALPKGYIRDYPQYEMRGGLMDVARKTFSIDYIEEIGKYMSWYKLNTLTLHINDNGGEYTSSFIVESKKYPALNANNPIVWTQEEYRQMQKNLKEYGVNVITEIDTPGHSKVFSNVNSTILNGSSFNLADYYDEVLSLVKSVYDEFLDGEDPVFQNAIVHIGTDESNNTKEDMRRYINDLAKYVLAKENVEKVVFWGNLSLYYGETEVQVEDVITQIWDSPDYRVDEALNAGYEVINSNSNMLYLVPGGTNKFGDGTYFAGYADMADLYDTWKGASDFTTHNLQKTHRCYAVFDILKANPKVLGAVFCEWNDTGVGFDYDIMELMVPYIANVAERCWYGDHDRFENGAEFAEAFAQVGDFAAYANPRYKVESADEAIAGFDFETDGRGKYNGYDAVLNGAAVEGGVLKLDGESSISLPFSGVGYPYTIDLKLYLDGAQEENAILFQNDECTVYLNYEGNGVTFRSGQYYYTFNAQVPANEWVSLMLTSQSPKSVPEATNISVLYLNGTAYFPTNLKSDRAQSRSTVLGTEVMFSGIKGAVDELYIFEQYNYSNEMNNFAFEGKGTAEAPYLIQNAEDLTMFSHFLNMGQYNDAYFLLTADIDMSNTAFLPAQSFSGTLDGGGHKITHLKIEQSGITCVGLIAQLNGGTIKNLGIEESTIVGGSYVGALAGRTMNAVIQNCYSSATVSGSDNVGGIGGMVNSTQIYNCYSNATVTATGVSVGGIAGSLNSSLNLENIVVLDNVYSTAKVGGAKFVGLIAGYDEGASAKTPVTMTNIYYFGTLGCSGNYTRTGPVLLTDEQVTNGTLLNALNGNLKEGYAEWSADESSYPTFLLKPILGDADGSGDLTSADVSVILKHLNGDEANINVELADMNGDGKLSLADALRLMKLLSE